MASLLEKIKKSISLKIAFLALIAFIIEKIISLTIDTYLMDFILLATMCVCILSLIFFFVFVLIVESLGKLSDFFSPILVMAYLTATAYLLNYLVVITFLSSYDAVVFVTDLVWKLLLCATGVLIFIKIALLVFGKKKLIEIPKEEEAPHEIITEKEQEKSEEQQEIK